MDINLAIPDYMVKALCGTLMHSLWQGLLLAAIVGVIVIGTRRSTPLFRYNLFMASLGLFVCAVAFTFIQQLHVEERGKLELATQQVNVHEPVTLSPIAQVKTSDYDAISAFVHTHASIIVTIWFLIVLARTLQLFTGLQGIYFLRRRKVSAIGSEWELKVKELAAQIGIKRLVRIAESGIAKVPMVIGHLKPLILIPTGLITALPPEGIEAILMHELAHIRRRDYLMNLMVSLMEIIFFFNPAVLWIASLIKAERENCCDDIALANTGNKADYIKALVTCEEYQLTDPAYAMAFSGGRGHLLGRVKRMLSNNNPSLNIIERAMLAIGLLTAILCTTAFSGADKINKLVAKVVHPHAAKVIVTPVKTIAKPGVTGAKPVVKIPARVKVKANYSIAKADTGKAKLIQTVPVAPIARPADPITPIKNPITPITPITNVKPGLGKLNGSLGQQSAAYNADANAYRSKSAKYIPNAAYQDNYKAYHDDTNRKKLTADLVADGIIQNADELKSFKLSDSEFTVNGKKMPDDTYQKYKKAYVPAQDPTKHGNWSWFYNYDGN